MNIDVVHHLNLFSDIVNQLDTVEIKFDDEVKVLILLASLLYNWDLMHAIVSNSIGKDKLAYKNIRNQVFDDKVRR